MARTEHLPDSAVVRSTALTELTRGYMCLRRSYAEGCMRATTDAELRGWEDRASRMRQHWELLNYEDLAEVLDAIAAVIAEQQAANAYIAAQIAVIQSGSLG